MAKVYYGGIISPKENGDQLSSLGISLGPWADGEFTNCVVSEHALGLLDPMWGFFYWSLEEVKNKLSSTEGEVNNEAEFKPTSEVKGKKQTMARRAQRSNPLAGGDTNPTFSTEPAQVEDPFAAIGGDAAPEADPFGAFASTGPEVEQGGLDALQGELVNGSSAVSPSLSSELLAQVNHLVLAQQAQASSAELKTFSDYVTSRFQAMENAQQQLSKQTEAVYKLLGTLPASLTESLGKWFDESLAKFNQAAGTVTASAGKPQTAGTAATSTASATAKAAPVATENPLYKSIIDATLPELRKRKAASAAFRLRYESTGPAVWGAIQSFCKSAGVECTPADAEQAYKASGRLKGGDDIDVT